MEKVDPIYVEILRRQSPAQKIATIHSLRRTAWELKAAWIRRCEPTLPEADVQERVRGSFCVPLPEAPDLISLFVRPHSRRTSISLGTIPCTSGGWTAASA